MRAPYITRHGYQTLSDELDFLLRTKRPELTRAVSEAAALGDRSENAEYIYGKKLLRETDRRIRFLQKRLALKNGLYSMKFPSTAKNLTKKLPPKLSPNS